MQNKNGRGSAWIVTGAALAGLAVILGSFGAHGLENMIQQMDDLPKRLTNWETGVHYQMQHAAALIFIGILSILWGGGRWLTAAGILFIVGILFFSTGLYVWVFTSNRFVVSLVPIGGLSFILGWLCIAIQAIRTTRIE